MVLFCSSNLVFSQNQRNNSAPSPLNLPPDPHFSWTNSCVGDTTCFINQSIRAYSYTWTITADTSTNPLDSIPAQVLYKAYNYSVICYCFSKPGTYSVTLTCDDSHIDSITVPISIDTITKAGFSFIHCANNFVNNSLCATAFYWDFGDGTNSTLAMPQHTYADTGSYQVTLIAYNGSKSDTIKKNVQILEVSYAVSSFTYTLSHDTLTVHALYCPPSPKITYNWSFGDGSFAAGQNAMHVYQDSTASYDAVLLIQNSCGNDFGVDTIKIVQLGPPPKPNFYYLNTCLGDTTCFINQTSGATSYTWEVSNTGANAQLLFTSNDSNTCFRFPATGSYAIALKALGNTYIEKSTQIITIGTIPVAAFSFTPCVNSFVNNSSCATSFYWNFGDGGSSTAIVPVHVYADTGRYQVTLIAYNGINADTITQQIQIGITSSANANFTSHSSNDTLWVHANYSGVPTATYTWSFGDGAYAGGQDTMHVYANEVATYNVKLSVTNLCGSASKTDTLKIVIPVPPPDLDFSGSVLTIVPNPVANSGYIDAFYNSYNSNNYLVQIHNILGQVLFKEYFAFQSGVNEFKISASNLATGVYIMALQSGNSYIRKKFYVINTP